MKAWTKLLISFAALLACGWIVHGPLGQGAAFVAGLQAEAEAAVRASMAPPTRIAFGHDPLTRAATLSGSANDFQRNGIGLLPGITGTVAAVPGVGAVHWADAGGGGFVLPLLVETEALALLPWLIGIALGWHLFRPRRETFL